MTLILHNAKIINPTSEDIFCGWIAVESDQIIEVQSGPYNSKSDTEAIDCKGQYVAPGIIDVGVKIGEPGERHKESFRTAGLAAARGGITTMITRPDTTPSIDNPETLEFFVRRAQSATNIRIYPMATLTKRREGNEIAEIALLKHAGAVAFSDCDLFVKNSKIMANCLKYCSQNNVLVMGHPQDPWLSDGASATSGQFATLKGLASVPTYAEKIGLERDLALVEGTKAIYHADQITTAIGVRIFKDALQRGLDISAGVSIHHLSLNDFDVGDYRTFFKVKPPLRSEDDRQAVIEALRDGTISILCSMHTPQDEETKRLPFEAAASGAVGLETLLPVALRLFHSGDLSLLQLFRALSLNPSRRFGLETGQIAKGYLADLIVFDPNFPFILDRHKLNSKSKNTPFDRQTLQGKILHTLVGGISVFSHE